MQGPWQIIDLPNGYFVVKFHLHENMNTSAMWWSLDHRWPNPGCSEMEDKL